METYLLTRSIPLETEYDILVAGGGPAGTAAAAVQAINTKTFANNFDTLQLVKTLRENGAFLPQKYLSAEMNRK